MASDWINIIDKTFTFKQLELIYNMYFQALETSNLKQVFKNCDKTEEILEQEEDRIVI